MRGKMSIVAPMTSLIPLPVGERWLGEAESVRGNRATSTASPSSGAARHLLPDGEKNSRSRTYG
ncbi:hypothetical protein ASD04_13825 [Devosia sp. Root436]|nr:hypothetical protein ASD04_13825 [Devosia sp. Root436]